MELNQTQKTLLGVVAQALTGTEYDIPKDTDWVALFAESKAQAVAPLVFSCVSEKCTDTEVFQKWKSLTMRVLQNNLRIQLQHDTLHRLMTKHNIPYCIIKGCASAMHYPDPLLRAMGDVDFLVSNTFWDKAKEVLLADGFTSFGEGHAFHLAFHKKNVNMEMHHEPFGLKQGGEELLKIVPELVDKSILVNTDVASFRMPDAFGHGIVIMLHAYRHLIDTGVGVRHLCDWATFIMKFSNQEFMDIFQKRFEKLGIWKLAQAFGTTAHCYLSVPYQEWMGPVDEDICRMLMLDIFNGGNFGHGDGERTMQKLSVYSTEGKISESNATIQLLRGLNRTAMERYPCLMKVKIFRPFGWIVLGARYVFQILIGKRKMPRGNMKVIAMRRELYQQLRVFDKD